MPDAVKDVIDSMTEKQKNIMYYIIGRAMEDYGMCNDVHVKKVIFNRPATIVFFEDGTKVVVKTKFGEVFDYEKGLAMAICKKALGDAYRSTFKKWVPETKKDFHYDHGNAKPIRNTKEFSSILKQLYSDMEDDD